MKNLKKAIQELQEEKPGLWANIRAKRARGEKPAHKNSNAHKDAVAAGKEINAMKEGEAQSYKKGDKLKIKLRNGKEFDVVFDMYSNTKGVALGKFKNDDGEYNIKPFGLDTVVNEANVNPEAEKLVSNFIMKLAKRYGYGAKDAIYLIQDVIKNIETSGKLNENKER